MIPRQQRLRFLVLVLILFKKPHEMYEAVGWSVLLWVNQVVGMKRYIEPGFLTNNHGMWWVNIDRCDGIWREKKGVTYTLLQ